MKKTIKGVQRKLGKSVMSDGRYSRFYRELLWVLKSKWNVTEEVEVGI